MIKDGEKEDKIINSIWIVGILIIIINFTSTFYINNVPNFYNYFKLFYDEKINMTFLNAIFCITIYAIVILLYLTHKIFKKSS